MSPRAFNLLQRWLPRRRPPASETAWVESVFERAAALRRQSDPQLRESLAALRQEPATRHDPDWLAAVFGLTVEAIRRTLNLELYPAQVLAGVALVHGRIAEMQTGEGKTLAAALPAVALAVCGRGVHVMTTNAYLAQRDWRLLSVVYQRLGLTAGLLQAGLSPHAKRAAYACDITYGPGYEFGFDYLRDQLARRSATAALGAAIRRRLRGQPPLEGSLLQRGRFAAVVDEADSVLIDEAVTPLVLSIGGGSPGDPAVYQAARHAAQSLRPHRDYLLEPRRKLVRLTAAGQQAAWQHFPADAPEGLRHPWLQYVEQAVAAEQCYARDIDYVVQEGRILLVDPFTGRIFRDRFLRDGLHQALEAKESLPVTAELNGAARMTRQRYFRLYEHLCGMTGTAAEASDELAAVYGCPVQAIPLRTPSRREELPTRYFADLAAKDRAVAEEVEVFHRRGQPVLVGTRTIEASRRLAALLEQRGVALKLLNGAQDEAEAAIVAQAGRRGAVTIATNMAGRGTDIRLAPGVAELGGLHVIGTERHESRRVDRQLIGRCARQGDPGSCRFFVSADDELLALYAPELAGEICRTADADGEARGDFAPQVHRAQRDAEAAARRSRRELFRHDDWLEHVVGRLENSL